jgi:flagellar biosynthesis protein FliQ
VTDSNVIHIGSQAMLMTAKLAAPILLTSLGVGLIISIFQSITQLQEVTLTFVPKLAAIALVFVFAGHWMLSQFTGYVQTLFSQVTTLLGS